MTSLPPHRPTGDALHDATLPPPAARQRPRLSPGQAPATGDDARRSKRTASVGRYFATSGLHLLLTVMAFSMVLPFCWMLLTSFKHISQVSDPNWIPAAPAVLKTADLRDPQRLIATFLADDALGAHLRSLARPQFLETIRAATPDQYVVDPTLGDSTAFDALMATLEAELNRIITATPRVFEPDAFANVELSTKTTQLMARLDSDPPRDDPQRLAYFTHLLNRRVLDDAFAGALRPTHALQWENFLQVFVEIPFARYYWNSIFVAAWVTFLQVFTSSLAAFSFARLKWPGRDKVFLIYLSTMMLPGLVMMIPNYQIMISLGLVDTMIGLVLPGAFSAFGTFLLRQFMLSIPSSLDEAAEIDGASKWRLYWDVILPLARPGLVTLAIFTFMGNYNSFFWPLVMLKSQHKYTLPIGLLYFDSSAGQETNLLMAAVAMSVLPMILVFVVLQKQLVAGIQLGAVKG